jgi:ABC-type nitrate/sulfonate/bicarbonate transport system permease component
MVWYVLRRTVTTIVTIVVSLVIFGFIWVGALKAKHVNAYVGKTPGDVWKYLFGSLVGTDGSTTADHRHQLFSLLWVTLGHASLGFVFGVAASVAIAIVFALARPVEFMFMPIAMLLRTVPLLAMAPVIYLVFGNGKVTAAFIGGVVVFFPLLVNLALGFRSVSTQSVDLIHVNGGGSWTVMRKVAIPTALPYFFASMRIAVPGAITGAMLYEWLFTYQGLGAGIVSAKSQSDYPQVWAIVAFVTVVAVLLYTVASIIETAVLSKWGPDAGRAA